MHVESNSQETLLNSIQHRIYKLEKKLNERLEKENSNLSLEGFHIVKHRISLLFYQ